MTPTKQQLLREIESLPESLATEALDFIAFIKSRYEGRNASNYEQSEHHEAMQSHRGGLSAATTSVNAATEAVKARISDSDKQTLVHSILSGKYAHLPNSSDDFTRRKQEEIDWEDRNR